MYIYIYIYICTYIIDIYIHVSIHMHAVGMLDVKALKLIVSERFWMNSAPYQNDGRFGVFDKDDFRVAGTAQETYPDMSGGPGTDCLTGVSLWTITSQVC